MSVMWVKHSDSGNLPTSTVDAVMFRPFTRPGFDKQTLSKSTPKLSSLTKLFTKHSSTRLCCVSSSCSTVSSPGITPSSASVAGGEFRSDLYSSGSSNRSSFESVRPLERTLAFGNCPKPPMDTPKVNRPALSKVHHTPPPPKVAEFTVYSDDDDSDYYEDDQIDDDEHKFGDEEEEDGDVFLNDDEKAVHV
jgi:hypothetical protein